MRKLYFVLLTTWLVFGANGAMTAQNLAEAQKLFVELQAEKTSDRATDQLRVVAKQNPDAREFLTAQLPTLIENTRGRVLENAVHLTGDLKIVEAISVLVKLLKDPYTKGGITNFEIANRLGDDPPGRALADIGESATEAVGALLRDQNRNIRWRAALVLGNINSAHADQLLESRLPDENDPAVRTEIQSRLGEHRKG